MLLHTLRTGKEVMLCQDPVLEGSLLGRNPLRTGEEVVLGKPPHVPEGPLFRRYALRTGEKVNLCQPLPGLFPGHPVYRRNIGTLEEVDQRLDRRRPDHHKRVRRRLPDVLRRVGERTDQGVHRPPLPEFAKGKGGAPADIRIAILQRISQAVDIPPRRHPFNIISLLSCWIIPSLHHNHLRMGGNILGAI